MLNERGGKGLDWGGVGGGLGGRIRGKRRGHFTDGYDGMPGLSEAIAYKHVE